MKLACHIVQDLLPLYEEGLLSEESAEDVRAHLAECPLCQRELAELQNAEIPAPFAAEAPQSRHPFRKAMGRFQRELHAQFCAAIVLFLLFGFSLTANADVLYNALIMPLAGMMSYFAFRLRAVYTLPCLLLITNVTAFLLGLVTDITFGEMLLWTLLYAPFALAGALAAFLLHFAFGKGDLL
jgi:hypothetical protein